MKNQLSTSPMKFMIRLSTFALIAIALVGCYEETQQQPDLSLDRREIEDKPQPQPESSPAPSVEPISPFYGSCHNYDCK
jgi:hypothetical protein